MGRQREGREERERKNLAVWFSKHIVTQSSTIFRCPATAPPTGGMLLSPALLPLQQMVAGFGSWQTVATPRPLLGWLLALSLPVMSPPSPAPPHAGRWQQAVVHIKI